MKKIFSFAFLLMVLAVGFATVSCGGSDGDDNDSGNDNDNGVVTTNSIVGTWEADDWDDGIYAYLVFDNNGTGKYSDQKVPQDYENFEYTLVGSKLLMRDTDYPKATWEEFTVKSLTSDKLIISFEDSYSGTVIESFHRAGTAAKSYSDLIAGKWTVTMDDPTWKCIVTFSSNGTFISKEYYDEDGNGKFSSYEGTYSGQWNISGKVITITPSNDNSVMSFKGTIESLTSDSGIFTDSDGWRMYLEK